METINVKLKEINPNPFKKEINGGKIDEEKVGKLIEGFKKTRFHENLKARRNAKGEIELVYGHHRIGAAKKLYGKDHEIKLDVYSNKEFSDEDMIFDMIRENLIIRDDFQEVSDSIKLVKKWLMQHKKPYGAKDIAIFLSKENKTISEVQIKKHLDIEDNLHSDLKEKVIISDRSGRRLAEDQIGLEVASSLSTVKKNEQPLLFERIEEEKGELNRAKTQKLIATYKTASPEIKEKLKKGDIKFTEMPLEIFKEEVKKKSKKKKGEKTLSVTRYKELLRQAGNLIGTSNDTILKTCIFFDNLKNEGILNELDWDKLDRIIEAGMIGGERYKKFMSSLL